MAALKLSILTVNYFSNDILERNLKYFTQLNSNIDFKWHLVDNCWKDNDRLKGFIHHDGIKHKVEPLRIGKIKLGSGSIHHGLGLNRGIEYLEDDADLWLVLDPDFIFLTSILDILENIKYNDIWFYGAEYVNERKKLIKGFPCAFCMFINPKFVKKEDLDFSVGFDNDNQLSEGWYPDVGFKVMYNFKTLNECNSGVFPKVDGNVYSVGKRKVGYHMRFKKDKSPQYNHNRPIVDIGNSKGHFQFAKSLIKGNKGH
jgi:hypothetical protein